MSPACTRLVALALTIFAAAPATAAASARVALVVGNAAYAARPLATAAADAGLVAQALAQAGYDVTAARDLDGKRLRATLRAFADRVRDAGPDATVLVYLSGLGVQYDGDNYVVPVDATLAHDDDVPLQAVDLDDFARTLATAPVKARVLVFDLARATAFAAVDEMPLAPGLALAAPPADTMVAFSAAPGMVSVPDAVPYGAYARALAEAIGTPGVSPAVAFERVRLRVGTLTDGKQVPWNAGILPEVALGAGSPKGLSSTLDGLSATALSPDNAYSAAIARDSLDGYADFLRAVSEGPLAARVRVLLAVRREAMTWQAALASNDPRAVWTYMRRYPRGPHRFDARRRLAALGAQLEPPPRFDLVVFPGLTRPSDAELAAVDHPLEAQRGLPSIPMPPETLLPPTVPAYADELPPPVPPPTGLLPVAATLPDLASDPGRIAEESASGTEVLTETSRDPAGAAVIDLSDAVGAVLEVTTSFERDGTRTVMARNGAGALVSRTVTTRVGDTVTTVQTDLEPATGPSKTGPAAATGRTAKRLEIVTRDDPEGGRSTTVTDGSDTVVAAWQRNAAGIVVVRRPSTEAWLERPIADVAPVPPVPTSPTVAVPPPVAPATKPPRSSSQPPAAISAPQPATPAAAAPPSRPAAATATPLPAPTPPAHLPNASAAPVAPAGSSRPRVPAAASLDAGLPRPPPRPSTADKPPRDTPPRERQTSRRAHRGDPRPNNVSKPKPKPKRTVNASRSKAPRHRGKPGR